LFVPYLEPHLLFRTTCLSPPPSSLSPHSSAGRGLRLYPQHFPESLRSSFLYLTSPPAFFPPFPTDARGDRRVDSFAPTFNLGFFLSVISLPFFYSFFSTLPPVSVVRTRLLELQGCPLSAFLDPPGPLWLAFLLLGGCLGPHLGCRQVTAPALPQKYPYGNPPPFFFPPHRDMLGSFFFPQSVSFREVLADSFRVF